MFLAMTSELCKENKMSNNRKKTAMGRKKISKQTIDPLDSNPENMREVMMDRDMVLDMVQLIAGRAAQGVAVSGLTIEGQNFYEQIAKTHMESNFNTVFEFAESPIETLFLSSLCMSFAMYDPFSAEFTPPINVEEYRVFFQEDREVAQFMWNEFQKKSGSDDIQEFIQDVNEFFEEMPDVPDDAASRVIRQHLLYNTFDLHNAYHFTLQPQINDIRVNGKSIRPDLYIWLPCDPTFKMIVELDGFVHHSGRTAFSNDRIRDRELQQKGFQVFRFSGHEIYHHPASKAYQLFEYLQKRRGKPVPSTKEDE
jgi:very-short-patch-repair endonuclease